jgi:hypothetical protein
MNEETWRDIPGYEGSYEVSDQGRVRSLDRETYRKRKGKLCIVRRNGRILKTQIKPNGYVTACLCCHDGESVAKISCYVHRLVALAFLGKPPRGTEVAHKNGKRADNRLSNICYKTPKENNADKLVHGTHNRGHRHSCVKLNESQVLEIFDDWRPSPAIAREYGVSKSAVLNIKSGRKWGWLTGKTRLHSEELRSQVDPVVNFVPPAPELGGFTPPAPAQGSLLNSG